MTAMNCLNQKSSVRCGDATGQPRGGLFSGGSHDRCPSHVGTTVWDSWSEDTSDRVSATSRPLPRRGCRCPSRLCHAPPQEPTREDTGGRLVPNEPPHWVLFHEDSHRPVRLPPRRPIGDASTPDGCPVDVWTTACLWSYGYLPSLIRARARRTVNCAAERRWLREAARLAIIPLRPKNMSVRVHLLAIKSLSKKWQTPSGRSCFLSLRFRRREDTSRTAHHWPDGQLPAHDWLRRVVPRLNSLQSILYICREPKVARSPAV